MRPGGNAHRLAVVLALCASVVGCTGTTSDERHPPVTVAKSDVEVAAPRSLAACGVQATPGPGSVSPEPPPGLSPDAPGTGDLVPTGAVFVAVCSADLNDTSRRHHAVEITGESLTSLVDAINAEPAYDPNGPCTADQSWTRIIVFGYPDGARLPVFLDASGCGLADNGAQQRLGGWEKPWDERLDHVTGRRD